MYDRDSALSCMHTGSGRTAIINIVAASSDAESSDVLPGCTWQLDQHVRPHVLDATRRPTSSLGRRMRQDRYGIV
jgi:hypothetical protein